MVAASDAGSGVDPSSIRATLDGGTAQVTWASGAVHIHVPKGRHTLMVSVGDYQETKNMEDVLPVGGSTTVTPNTATLRTTVVGG